MSDRFDELYELYADGALDAEQRREFLALLNDPENRARFVSFAMYETVVNDELRITREELHADTRRGEIALKGESQRAQASKSIRGKSVSMNPRMKLAIGVAALLLIGLAAYAFIPRSRPAPRESSHVAGQRSVFAIAEEKRLYEGDAFDTEAQASTLRFPDEQITAQLRPHTLVRVELRNGSKALVQRSGRLQLDVPEQPSALPFVLELGEISAELPSGSFKAALSDRGPQLSATSGSASLKFKDQSAVLPTGHFARVVDGKLTIAPIPGEKIRFATYNLAQSLESEALQANAEVIRSSGAEIVALQKVRRDGPLGTDDRLQRLVEDLGGWHFAFVALPPSKGLEEGEILIDKPLIEDQACVGNAIISKHSIESAEARMLTFNPPPEELWKEKRAVLRATIKLPSGRKVNVFSAHFSINEQENKVHVAELIEFAKKSDAPRIIGGNLHCGPHRTEYKALAAAFADAWTEGGKGDGFTHPVPVGRWRTDMIFYDKDALNIREALVGGRGLSDHYSVIAEFALPWDDE
ncbi:MAG TPA: endonuclease/exonuclease/phosphatase family protein [Planctomycetota bacterium]|nr:endonuclease/exonuclease/phosphatase family protein [Planctomycetota bacterium]